MARGRIDAASVGTVLMLALLGGCGHTASDIGNGAVNAGIADPALDRGCLGRLLEDSGASAEFLGYLTSSDDGDGSGSGGYSVSNEDGAAVVEAVAVAEKLC